MLEGVRLCPAAGRVEQLPEDDHGGVSLARAAGPRHNDGLGVAGLALQSDHFLDYFGQFGALLTVSGRAEGQGVSHVAVRVHGEDDGADVGLQRREREKTKYNIKNFA